ncbi:MAG: hypothetical protein UR52_C0003G0004 [Candidatus Gottesmanbacteria bacterium GW2011_GWA1_34_13]|uniref:O-antigen ligase-related domain-containing protein n=1 Tax=Candidatus Gottesmanbacteria bacterium GW2011_GWA1_34_13 TaxID=1618434 RepID=A0A0G0DX68_9BACT|nr:MAG: hypothetical protein UR52_C0003G0004 [Candidatus Gottesmanbacteria bacterium GW2011_GWA1_34_13]
MKLEKVLDKIIEYGFYLLFFATPLLFNPSRNFPSYELFEWNKMIFVYFMTVLITGAWIGKMILNKKFLVKRTPFDIPLVLFLISQGLSTLFSIDRHVSIFGYYSRFHGGLLSTISYLLLFYAFVANFESVKLKRLFSFIMSSAIVVVIYGILEKFGIDANMWVQDVRSRVFSTLGQPNWLAAYLAILIPLLLYKLFEKFNPSTSLRTGMQNDNEKFKIKLLNIVSLILIGLLAYICLLFTKSRSGFLGFWGANIIFWIGLFLIKNWHWVKIIKFQNIGSQLEKLIPNNKSTLINSLLSGWNNTLIRIFLLANFSLLIINFIIRTPFPQYNKYFTWEITQKQMQPEETTVPVGDSVINIGITDSSTIRKIVWKGALDIARAYPIFGTGPETFAYAYYKFRPAEHNLTSEWDFLYNKAHNEYLNFAATSGFLGLGIYLLLIIWILAWIIGKLFQTADFQNKVFILSLLAAFISILITNFFGFSVVIVGLYFFFIPAFVFILKYPVISVSNPENEPAKLVIWQKILLISLSLAVLYLCISLSIYWLADSFYARAVNSGRQTIYDQAYKEINIAIDMKSDEPNYHDEKANITSSLALAAFEQQDATLSSKYVLEAVSESTKALKISPQNINFWKTRTRILFALSDINSAFSQSALEAIKITQELAPTDAKISYNVAVIASRVEKFDEAIQALQKAITLKPDYRDAYIALSIFYTETGKKDKAKEILEEVLKKIDPNDMEVKTRLEKL